jgi:uncharacterized protein YukE
LKESERRFKLINEISKSEEKKKIIVTIEEVKKAIQNLNSGKAADEYGITAEHVKFAGSEIYTLYQDIFNQIFQEGVLRNIQQRALVVLLPYTQFSLPF